MFDLLQLSGYVSQDELVTGAVPFGTLLATTLLVR